jgi:hypothetical protein
MDASSLLNQLRKLHVNPIEKIVKILKIFSGEKLLVLFLNT